MFMLIITDYHCPLVPKRDGIRGPGRREDSAATIALIGKGHLGLQLQVQDPLLACYTPAASSFSLLFVKQKNYSQAVRADVTHRDREAQSCKWTIDGLKFELGII
jgi:hypothetical protein